MTTARFTQIHGKIIWVGCWDYNYTCSWLAQKYHIIHIIMSVYLKTARLLWHLWQVGLVCLMDYIVCVL